MRRRGGLRRTACRVRYSVRAIVSTHPSIYLPIARRKYDTSKMAVTPETELVIEGFPRSGNTFAVVAFELAQRRQTQTAHHLHAVAQVVAGARLGIPVLLLIRDPDESVLSHVLREPCITTKQALLNWIRFYEGVLPYQKHMVIGEFGLVTSDLGTVIAEINRRFGTGFERFEHTDVNVARCFQLIDEMHRRRYGTIVDSHIARPSAQRDQLKRVFRENLGAPSLSRLRDRARSVYRTLVPA